MVNLGVKSFISYGITRDTHTAAAVRATKSVRKSYPSSLLRLSLLLLFIPHINTTKMPKKRNPTGQKAKVVTQMGWLIGMANANNISALPPALQGLEVD